MELVSPEIGAVLERARQAQNQAMSTGRLKSGTYSEFHKEKADREIEENVKRAGLGVRYRNCTFDAMNKRQIPGSIRGEYLEVKKYADNLSENIKNGTGLLLKGPVGTMKTSLAAAVLLHHIHQGGQGMFISMSSLLDTIFSLKAKNVGEWAKFENNLRKTSILVIDDLGAEYTEGWVLTKVDAIISERYNNMLPIIVTTNLSANELKATYAERVIDRIRSTMLTVSFSGQSLRSRAV